MAENKLLKSQAIDMEMVAEIFTPEERYFILTLGHQDALWLAGQVFLSRDFVEGAEERGLDAVFAAAPFGDLTEEEKATFAAAFNNPRLREVVKLWWQTYDEERANGTVPRAGYWQ